MKSLFGDEIDPIPARHRKDNARPAPIGSGPDGETCRTCRHCRRVRFNDKNYHKCGLMRDHWTHGPGSDIRLKDAACRWFETDMVEVRDAT